ncbi:MAG: zinc ribbon domain-containing protein [Actinobacteria bacterium]|nr:zinc ribbon domain-containing protein [Actinomycetota bacterium]
MICPECGSYQPERAKFCGICGTPLSQESLVESFLSESPEPDIALPRRRSLWFYLAVFLLVLASLAVLAGAGYFVYRMAWGGKGEGESREESRESALEYRDDRVGYSLAYPDNWTLSEQPPANGALASVRISLSSRKLLDIQVSYLDPVVSIGGLEAIKEYLEGIAEERIRALGGTVTGAPPDTGEEGVPGGTPPAGEAGEDPEIFTYTRIGNMPAFYVECDGNVMGEETTFILCFVVADDCYFQCEGRAPRDEYRGVRPQFWSIFASLRREAAGEEVPASSPQARKGVAGRTS